jgi:hypothetical protein
VGRWDTGRTITGVGPTVKAKSDPILVQVESWQVVAVEEAGG